VQGASNFVFGNEVTKCDHLHESYWAVLSYMVLFIMRYKVIPTSEFVDEIPGGPHLSESYWAVFFCGAVYYAVRGRSNCSVCEWNP